MEKIYMNENKNKKQSVMNTSVVLSFVVSIFAIVSLAVFGIVSSQGNNVTYAALNPDTQDFKLHQLYMDSYIESDTGFATPYYAAGGDVNNPVFCIEKHRDPKTVQHDGEADATYTKGDVIEDYGLLYLLNNTYASGKKVTNIATSVEYEKLVESWITQTAIWYYLKSTDSASPNYMTGEEITKIESANTLVYFNNNVPQAIPDTEVKNVYTQYIKPLVDAAKNAKSIYKLNITKNSDDFSLTEDKKFYESPLITVTTDDASAFASYAVTLSGIEGAFLIDENGDKIDDLTAITAGTKFRVRIPADKVTEKVQNLKIDVKGKFNSLTGYEYTSAPNVQKIVSVMAADVYEDASIELEVVGTPDTGMNTAQTIYFIGLIVLLCGVGIVYANAKPVQAK